MNPGALASASPATQRAAEMVDEARVAALLHRITSEADAIDAGMARTDEVLLSAPDAIPALKYRLVILVEAATDAADHVIAAEGLRPSTSFADSFRSLAEAGWLDDDLASMLSDAARFRNLLVHGYADVDDGRVLEIARTRMADLRAFVAVMASRLS